MTRVFADLHLCVNTRDSAASSQTIRRASELGYKLVSVPFWSEAPETEISKLRACCVDAGVDYVSRVDLRPKSQNDLMRQLRKLRRRFEVVCVACENKEVARQAAKDHRVDLLSFPSLDFRRRFFDRAEAELASNSLAALEIDIKPLLVLEGPSRIRLLSNLRREVAVAIEFHVPIIVSSGVGNEWLLRRPREMAALAGLTGLGSSEALDAVSKNPCSIVYRNRGKLSSGFVAPGIRIIREGSDC